MLQGLQYHTITPNLLVLIVLFYWYFSQLLKFLKFIMRNDKMLWNWNCDYQIPIQIEEDKNQEMVRGE